ncbi:MAG: F0F1 ATP synthase subunit delta, partial [Sphingomonadaceae bacterium]|nr:F0F1 ATP synthase subunit delta [Sphingomonadaceae bacterium]
TDEAGAAKTKAEDALADVEKTRAGFAKEREAVLATAHEEAEAAHAARLAEAETEVAVLQAAAKAAAAKNTKVEAVAWADRSSDLAVVIAQRLVARLDGVVVDSCFFDWLVAEIGQLPKTARDAAGATEARLEVTTASKPDAVARKHIIASIGKALGGAPHITFKTDPALIAGIELRGEHLIVNSSWHADLGAIRADLMSKPAA